MTDQPDPADQPFGMSPEELMRRLASGSLGPAEMAQIQQEISQNFGMNVPPEMIQQAMAQMQAMMSAPDTGPLNEDLARQSARQTVAGSSAPAVTQEQARQALDALRVATMWLDTVTTLPSQASIEHVWSGTEWVEATFPTWLRLCRPIAEHVNTELSRIMAEQMPEQARAMLGEAATMMRKIGGAAFGAQVGQAIGHLGREVTSAHDIGLPLAPPGTTALLPGNIATFGEGLEIPEQEVSLYLALRESAYARLFAHAPWVRERLIAGIEAFARGITIDVSALEEAVRSIDPTDPQSLQQALSGGVFEPQRTPQQQAALTHLETTLALIEGWVDEVTHAAASAQLPSAAAMRETVRRRRATGGPAEHTLSTLVGLHLRPRRLRDAATLWAAVASSGGVQARDEIWNHPDLLPTTEDLDDPLGYAQSYQQRLSTGDEVDAALRDLLGD